MNRIVSKIKLNHRQKKVLNHVLNFGRCQVHSLAYRFDVSEQTIRSDLNKLCDLKLLKRIHGGAITLEGGLALDGTENLGYLVRNQLNIEGKKWIGLKAAEMIPNNSSLFINIGTTTESVANALRNKVGLMVVTNSINIANTLRYCDHIKVMTAGGLVRQEDGGIIGEAAIEFMEQFRLDYAIIGVSALEMDGILLDFDFREVRVARSIIKNSRSVILVADKTKFDRKASVRLADLSQIDYFVTDQAPPKMFVNSCTRHHVQICVAEPRSV